MSETNEASPASKAGDLERLVMRHWDVDGVDITLKSCERIVSIEPCADGGFDVVECCDRYYSRHYTKQEMVELLNEALQFVLAHDA